MMFFALILLAISIATFVFAVKGINVKIQPNIMQKKDGPNVQIDPSKQSKIEEKEEIVEVDYFNEVDDEQKKKFEEVEEELDE